MPADHSAINEKVNIAGQSESEHEPVEQAGSGECAAFVKCVLRGVGSPVYLYFRDEKQKNKSF